MADTAVANQASDASVVGGGASPPATAKKAVASSSSGQPQQKKGKGARNKPSHPRTADMVNGTIKSLKERGGSSLQAIKKYLLTTYKIDAKKMSPFIKKYIKDAVAYGALIHTKDKGASGSFKLAADAASSSAGGSEAKAKKEAVAAAPPRRPKAAVSPVKKASAAKTPAERRKKKKAPTPAATSPQKKAKVASAKKKTAAPAAGRLSRGFVDCRLSSQTQIALEGEEDYEGAHQKAKGPETEEIESRSFRQTSEEARRRLPEEEVTSKRDARSPLSRNTGNTGMLPHIYITES